MATIVISAYDVVNCPLAGGHFWVYLQYVLGLRLLGHDVYWLEAFRSKGRTEEEAALLAAFRARIEQYGLANKCILYLAYGKEPSREAPADYLNMTRAEAEAIFARADLVNMHGIKLLFPSSNCVPVSSQIFSQFDLHLSRCLERHRI